MKLIWIEGWLHAMKKSNLLNHN